ncbi:metalloregulator ArsR/SmtB family transcription factor [Blastococcus sp. URHD0036]|uniref:ArsR/SmtB family transcription factor n=1 Tax=Blastococcus sp. URHD0036 TaxID=1380356 RepID=UPI000554E327
MGSAPHPDVFRALADPVRWALLERLSREPEVARKDLYEALALPQTALSYHLHVLLDAGLVEIRKDGRKLYCRLSHRTLSALQDALGGLTPCDEAARGDSLDAARP